MSFEHGNGTILTIKQSPSLLTRLFVRGFGLVFLLSGLYLFVANMVKLALTTSETLSLFLGLLLLLSGYLLIRLRLLGIWIFGLIFILSCSEAIFIQYHSGWINFEGENFGEDSAFLTIFLLPLTALLIFTLLMTNYCSLSRTHGRRPRTSVKFLIFLLYIALTGTGVTAYYDQTFCLYDRHLEPVRLPYHATLMASSAQWLFNLSCHDDGNLSFE